MSIFVLVGIVLVAVSIVLMALGARKGGSWALFAANTLWLLGAVAAGCFTYRAWLDRDYSENWAMFGVIFFVWPYSLFAMVMGTVELVLLRKRRDRPALIARIATITCMVLLIAMSVIGLVSG